MRFPRTLVSPRLLGSAAMLSLACVGCLGCSGQSAPPAIFLGHIATLSGADSRAGKSAEQGIRLALEELGPAASEPFQGRPIVVRHVDAGGKLDNMEAEAARLVSVNRVWALLGGTNPEEALRLDRSRVPVLAATGFRTAGMSDLLFTSGLAPNVRGQVLAEFLADEAPQAGTLIVDSRQEEALVAADQFRRTWHEVSLKKNPSVEPPRWRELSLPKDPNLAELAGTIGKEQRHVIVFIGAAAEFVGLRKVWGSSAPLMVYAGADGSFAGFALVPGQTVYVATAFAFGKEMTKAQDFAKKYRQANHEEPDVSAAVAYDDVRLLVEAMKKAQAPTPEKLREELVKIQDYPGLTGPLSFTPEQRLRRTVFVARIEGPGRIPSAVKSYNP